MDKRVSFILRSAASVLLLWYIVSRVDVSALLSVVAGANLLAIPAIVFLFLLSFGIKALNYRLFTLPVADIKAGQLMRISLLSWAAGMVAPGKTGEFSAIYFLHKQGVPLGVGTAVSVLDKLITLSLLSVIAALALLRYLDNRQAFVLIGLLLAGLVVAVIAIASGRMRGLVRRYILRKYESKFSGFSRYLREYVLHNKILFLANVGLAVAWLYVSAAMIWVGLLAVGIPASLWTVFLVSSASLIIATIPVTLGGIGARETVLVLLFERAGMGGVEALAGISLVTLVSFSLLLMVAVFGVFRGTTEGVKE